MASPAVGLTAHFIAFIHHGIRPKLTAEIYFSQFGDAANTFTYQEVFEASGDFTNNDENAKVGYLLLASPVNAEHLVFVYILSTHGDMDIFYRDTWNKGFVME
jgi:hypothetical protein